MEKNKSFRKTMRIYHRHLGFFLAGIMAVYAISGVTLIFRDSDFLKQEIQVNKQIKANARPNELGQLLGIRNLQLQKEEGNKILFENGVYDKSTGKAEYTVKELPYILNKLTILHKAKTSDPLFFLNIFFGISLLFFVFSAFFMFLPKTTIFKKGLYFSLGGILLTLVLIFF